MKKNIQKIIAFATLMSSFSLCAQQDVNVYDGSDGSAFPWLPGDGSTQIKADGKSYIYKNYNAENGNSIVSNAADKWFMRNDNVVGGSHTFVNSDIDLRTNLNGVIFNTSRGDFSLTFDSSNISTGSGCSISMTWNIRESNVNINFLNGTKVGQNQGDARMSVNFMPREKAFTSGSAQVNISGSSSAATEIAFWNVNVTSATAAESVYKNSLNIYSFSNVKFNDLSVGSDSAAGSATSTLRVDGENSKINVEGNLKITGSSLGTSSENPVGGVLEFVADDYGVSTLEVSRVSDFSGVLSLDFSGIKLESDTLYEFVLISATNDWTDIGNELVSSDRIFMKTANTADEWDIYMDGNRLILEYVTAVPEPSTLALLFGAFAFAFATYSKGRKR